MAINYKIKVSVLNELQCPQDCGLLAEINTDSPDRNKCSKDGFCKCDLT